MPKKTKRKSAKFNSLDPQKKPAKPTLKCSHRRSLKDILSSASTDDKKGKRR